MIPVLFFFGICFFGVGDCDDGSEIDYEKELEYMNENLPVQKQEFVEICAWNVCKEFVMSIKPDGDKVIELRTNRDGFQLIFIRDGDSIPTKEEFCLELGIDLSMYMNCEHLIMNEKLDKLLDSNSNEEIPKGIEVSQE